MTNLCQSYVVEDDSPFGGGGELVAAENDHGPKTLGVGMDKEEWKSWTH